MCVKLHSVCVKLHTVCEITQCAQNYTYSIGKNSSQLENFTLTPLAALATNISCGKKCAKYEHLLIKRANKSECVQLDLKNINMCHCATAAHAPKKGRLVDIIGENKDLHLSFLPIHWPKFTLKIFQQIPIRKSSA